MHFPYTFYWPEAGAARPRRETITLDSPVAGDHILQCIAAAQCFYEYDLLRHLARTGPRGGLFVDVGANIGNHAIFFAKYLAAQVLCVEPAPALVEALQGNLRANNVTHCTVVQAAAGAAPGHGEIVQPDGANTGMARFELKTAAPAAGGAEQHVPVKPLDRLLQEMPEPARALPVQLIKIDVEGMQMAVLRGAEETLRAHTPQLVIEANTASAQAEVQAFLQPFGYVPAGRFCATPTFHFIHPERHALRRPSLAQDAAARFADLRRAIRRRF